MRQTLLTIIICLIWISGQSQECRCPDYEFSESRNRPVIKINNLKNQLIVCGYDIYLDNGAMAGVQQKDSSIYLSGFNVFTCLDQPISIVSFGELNEYKLRAYKDYLTIDLMMNLPVDRELNYKYAPLIRYKVTFEDGKWVLEKPYLILDFSALDDNDFFKIRKDLGWDKLYPEFMFARNESYAENRLMYAFIVTLKYFPRYNQDFNNLGKMDGYILELHDEFMRILKEIE
jgi:hypothetical protein